MDSGQLPINNVTSTSLVLPGLNLRPGHVVEAEIRRKFGTTITPNSPFSRHFWLVVTLGDANTKFFHANATIKY